MKQSKRYGQIFLSDKKYVEKILDSVGADHEAIVEIGPGGGAISEGLCSKAKKLVCIEVHKRLAQALNKRFQGAKNITIINDDILKFDISKLGTNLVLVGNLPYHISKQLVLYFIKYRSFIQKGIFMFQSEFIDKIIADVGDKEYSAFSCYVRYYSDGKRLFKVAAEAFDPVPKVDSAVISMAFDDRYEKRACDEKKLFDLINFAFSQ
ncbi:MAG: 16S rRNA (adenine(1518)-N(6)/adenine(1519)-N(6))-dimethyltransferase RsmA, partial [Candidatus Omnitrophica bacterium]|nr:16S rRNA (adenine(1518)-N(6)/adenine(1519)-N(6))-dimethyltransferase RsmA [Candidatus Omnitrophota bacterium]